VKLDKNIKTDWCPKSDDVIDFCETLEKPGPRLHTLQKIQDSDFFINMGDSDANIYIFNCI
jgi:hypothetical protein